MKETWEEEHKLVQKKVRREILAAIKKGQAWTKPRPFINWTEKVGKMRCSPIPRPRKCTRRATYVSYCTRLAGCVVYCDHCVQRSQR